MPEIAEKIQPAKTKKDKVIQFPKTVVQDGKRYNTQFRVLQEKKEIKSADPIREEEDINRVVSDCLSAGLWRDAMLFVLGCNTAFRISDLLCYRVSDIIGINGEVRLSFIPKEQKNGHFRKVYYNEAIMEMMNLYIKKDPSLRSSSFLFYNHSRNARLCKMDNETEVYEAMTRQSAGRLIKNTMQRMMIDGHYSTHSLRQTFTYHFQKMMFGDSEKMGIPLTIQALQMMLGHTRMTSTVHYSKYVEEKIAGMYGDMNLGLGAIQKFNLFHQ